LLPRWRGAAPINRAIMAGGAETGVVVVKMEEGVDTRPVAMAEGVPVPPDTPAGPSPAPLGRRGGGRTVAPPPPRQPPAPALTSQPAEGVTYAAKIGNDETRIVWTRPAQAVHDHIRGLSPFPGAWFELSDNGKPVRVKVLRTTQAAGSGSPGTLLDDALTVA